MTTILMTIAAGCILKLLHNRIKEAIQIANVIMEIEEELWQ